MRIIDYEEEVNALICQQVFDIKVYIVVDIVVIRVEVILVNPKYFPCPSMFIIIGFDCLTIIGQNYKLDYILRPSVPKMIIFIILSSGNTISN